MSAPATAQQGQAPATQQDVAPAIALLKTYWPQLKRLLPPHVVAESWYSAVHAALYRGKDASAKLDLWRAANGNPESLIFALYEAARLGLEPGTELYYLTPRPNRKARNGVEVLGIVGYRGDIQLIYNGGAVASVVVEVVHKNDSYRYLRQPGEVPEHKFDPWARRETRGDIVGVYAYGVMTSGAISRVIELNMDDIDRAMKSSPTSNSPYSPWHTDFKAMVLKTGAHRLRNWVPWSATLRYLEIAAQATATAVGEAHGQAVLEQNRPAALPAGAEPPPPDMSGSATRTIENPAANTDEPPAEPLDVSQFVQPPAPGDPAPLPSEADGSGDGRADVDDADDNSTGISTQDGRTVDAVVLVTEFEQLAHKGDEPPARKPQLDAVTKIMKKGGQADDERQRAIAARMVGHQAPLAAWDRLTYPEAARLIDLLGGWSEGPTPVLNEQLKAIAEAIAADERADGGE